MKILLLLASYSCAVNSISLSCPTPCDGRMVPLVSSGACCLLRLRGAGESEPSAAPTVTVYMHGTPKAPSSDEACDLLGILRKHQIDFIAYDVGADKELRDTVARRYNWKTFPQLHTNGRLLGDATIVKELDEGGEFISELNAFQTMPAIDESIITHTESHNNAGAKEHANAHTTTPGDVAAAWKSAVQNVPLEGKGGAAGEDDLIDEQQLLTDESLAVTKKPEQECGPESKAKRKACKNCSCGLAEELAVGGNASSTGAAAPENAKSACGSCYLGDAFRCESCPYKGLPPFKAGEKVALSLVDDL
eukprot:CAMPEP_0179465796 /NCGR_PEP_ID=MMETSP0799-20121207/47293_1 /TAXON_ID=46947 /ORGANISM="Geminigera cryophila, Strain CCMP2564" /LENGTH=305 /DNA_ID=CAMNT_0021270299 /DNA_START=119 /DNA_END=1036 /DNA_ORIENTATION=+